MYLFECVLHNISRYIHKLLHENFEPIYKKKYVLFVELCMVGYLDLPLPVQSVPITIKVVNSNPVYGEVYSIQHYVIKFVSDLRHVGGFLRFSLPKKLNVMM